MSVIRIYLGWDRRESVAYHVMAHSILSRSSSPVAIIPLNRRNMHAEFTRPRGEKDSTDFSNSRWIIPFLQDYDGWAIYAEPDMLMRGDIAQLWALRDDRYSIMCRQHVHVPQETTKFLGNEQTKYDRKNWSSLMLMNCSRLRMLTRHLVNTGMHGLWFHQLRFLPDEEIGDLPVGWNHLVGYDEFNPEAPLVHFTTLGPWHAPDTREIEYSNEWRSVARDMIVGENPHIRRMDDIHDLMR